MAANFVSYQTFLLGAEVSHDPLDQFSQHLHHMVGIELQMINPTFFFRYIEGSCHGNQFCGKITYPLHLLLWHLKMEWDIATAMYTLTVQVMRLYRVKTS